MPTVRTRTRIIALIAGLSVGTATIAPAVSQADTNNHGYQKTVGKRVRPWMNTCANAIVSLDNWSDLASQELANGEAKAAAESIDIASKIKENAKASGCKGLDLVKAPVVARVSPVVSLSSSQ